MISIRYAEDRDQAGWDAYVDADHTISPCCRFSWKKAVAEAYGHQGYYLIAEMKDKLIGIFPLIHLKIPFGRSSLVSLPYCDTGGLHALDSEASTLLLQEAVQLRAQLKAHKLVLRGLKEFIPTAPVNGLKHVVERSKVSMRLGLPESVDELWGGFKSKLRSQITKAKKNGLVFRWGNEDNMDDFYDIFCRNMHELGSPVHSKKWLNEIFLQYGESAKLGLVYNGKKAIGGGVLLCNLNTNCVPWASTFREHNNLNPNMLLYWNFLKFSVENNRKEFDFGRSTLGGGTYKFKKQWGAVAFPLCWHSISTKNDKAMGKTRNFDREMLVAAWRTLPLSLVNIIGPIFRKYISL